MQNPVRCAIYSRKSNENGLELAYNSIAAQRDHCKGYIKSREEFGWQLINKRYDDAGFSGGNMNRPALQRLLKDVSLGLIDVVVAYRYDRLTRSFLDFARILESFEKNGANFVSVSEAIDTTTPIGRMLPAMLILIAQTERENDSARIRDKFRMTRSKGMWIGGVVPEGYTRLNKRLVPVPEVVETIQFIYKRFLEIGSPLRISQELRAKGVHRQNGKLWNKDHVHTVLRNPVYAGKLWTLGENRELVDGVHEAVVTYEEWRAANERMKAKHTNTVRHSSTYAVLKGLLVCGLCGRVMGKCYTSKGRTGKIRYSYYKCAHEYRTGEPPCGARPLPTKVVHPMVMSEIAKFLSREANLRLIAGGDEDRIIFYRAALRDRETLLKSIEDNELERLANLVIDKITAFPDHLVINFKTLDQEDRKCAPNAYRVWKRIIRASRFTCVIRPMEDEMGNVLNPTQIVTFIAKARKWIEMMGQGLIPDATALAKKFGMNPAYFSKVMLCAFTSPELVEKLVAGELPNLSITQLVDKHWSVLWEDQHLLADTLNGLLPKGV